MQKLRDEIKIARAALQHLAHRGERPLHLMYFILVCWEAHGFYGIAAGACAAVIVIGSNDAAA